ncbi:hypothetical protein ACFRIB_32540 [Streptomyces mirabilis]|uniref:hypothetical protein n=1 Tax=Streptomyces mirabilis TaxID=68239 RepID=UPI003693CFAF
MLLGKPADAVYRAGFRKPGPDLHALAVNGDFLSGDRYTALAVQEEFEDLHGLGEGAYVRCAP